MSPNAVRALRLLCLSSLGALCLAACDRGGTASKGTPTLRSERPAFTGPPPSDSESTTDRTAAQVDAIVRRRWQLSQVLDSMIPGETVIDLLSSAKQLTNSFGD